MAKKLREEFRSEIRVRHYSYRTEETYWKWIRRFILYHGKRHPREMGAEEIQAFLSYLATDGHLSASPQNQALSALLFLYKKGLQVELPWMDEIVRAKRPARVPIVMTKSEVARVLKCLQGKHWLMASFLYGSGLRLTECLRLRVQDIDTEYLQLTIRDGKGNKDRRTILPDSLLPHIEHQLDFVRGLMERDIEEGENGAITLTPLVLRAPSRTPSGNRESTSVRQVIPSVTRSPRTCSRVAMTFAQCRNC